MFTTRQLILSFIKCNKLLVIATFFAAIFSSMLTVVIPLSIGRFYELVLHDHSVKGKLFNSIGITLDSTRIFFAFFISIIIAKAVITLIEKFFTGVIGERFSRDLRELLFHTQLSHSVSTHRLKPTGKYLLRYSGDLVFIQRFISKGVIEFTGDIIFLGIAFTVLFLINPTLTIFLFASIAISCAVIILLNKRLRNATINRRNQRSTLLGFVANRMQAFFTIKSFNREVPEASQYNKRSAKLYDSGINYWKIYALIQALMPLLLFGTLTFLLYYISTRREVKPYGIARTDVLDFVLLFLYMQGVLRRVLKVNVVWQMGSVSFMKLMRILNFPSEVKSEKKEIREVTGKVCFENVSFKYPNANDQVLHDVSFVIQPNTITLIKGKQGSGKTTLLKLIIGIFPASGGKIFLDEYDYASLNPNVIRRVVAIVSDEAPLLGNTVFKAVSYSRVEEKRLKAAQLLQRLNFNITQSEDEILDYHLDDFGNNLSAGQRKQLMFARALLTRKKILVLDEAFDDLDAETKKIVVERINKQKSRRTIIVAANNVPPELKVDQVICLNEYTVQKQLIIS